MCIYWERARSVAQRQEEALVSQDHARPWPGVTVFTFGVDPQDYGDPAKGGDVVIEERGCALILRFRGRERDAPLKEIRLVPGKGTKLDLAKAREFVPRLDRYLAVGRAALAWDHEGVRAAATVLRQDGRPGRGLSPDFIRLIAQQYEARVAEGDKHPIKTLADMYHVTPSPASRWVTRARDLGYLPPKEAKSHAR
jgi:hypothetical protein